MKTELTPRESMLWAMAASGASDKQICQETGLSKSTVSDYLQRVREKLGIAHGGQRSLLARYYIPKLEALQQTIAHLLVMYGTPRPCHMCGRMVGLMANPAGSSAYELTGNRIGQKHQC